MTDQITQYSFEREMTAIAKDILSDYEGEPIEECSDDIHDRARETADGHEWVIYTYKAMQVCQLPQANEGEEWLADCHGKPFDGCETYSDVVTRLAYATVYCGISAALGELISELEEENAN